MVDAGRGFPYCLSFAMSVPSQPSVISIRPSRQMYGDVTVPGDKMIAQIGVLLAAFADGDSVITGYPWFGENMRLPQALQGLGVQIDASMAGGVPGTIAGVATPPSAAAATLASMPGEPAPAIDLSPSPPKPDASRNRANGGPLRPLCEPLDCGESGTALRLLTA